MPVRTNDIPALTDKRIKHVYIKNGKRYMMTDSGKMAAPASLSRMMFGKLKGGKYNNKK